jgi:DNA-binding response OmpR family regulator
MRVLYVVDTRGSRAVVDYLEATGLEVHVLPSVDIATVEVARIRPDVVIVDAAGECERLRADDDTHVLRVIGGERVVDRGDDVMMKPFSLRDLGERIGLRNRVLAHQALAIPARAE